MKISYNWLKHYIDPDMGVEELGALLTDSGLEVEGIETFQSVKGGLEGLVIGEVISCEKHPNADKLSKTTVNVGGEELLPIVCGAPNVAAGQKVVVATVGTMLYSGDESFEIRKAKIRGEESRGMICAEDEIGLGKSHEGIMVLDPSALPGTPAKKYFEITEDHVFEIGLTPNRTDAMGHIGAARDIMAMLNSIKKENHHQLNIPPVDQFKAPEKPAEFPVEIEDASACPRFSGVTISGVKVGPSPQWMQDLLNAIGIRPINNIVDITNFVLMETGQPLHAYDTAAIEGGKVVVRMAREGEKFITLDETERSLRSKDLMICNANTGMCMAGVFGGDRSGVTEKTQNIFLESAHFDPATIRSTARHHQLATDASFRFERGTDINNTLYAMKRAALLIAELAGGEISSEVVDVYPQKVEGYPVELSYSRLNKLIGQEIEESHVNLILSNLDIEILGKNGDMVRLMVPTYRYEVRREADVVEEVLRIFGYNNITFPDGIRSSLAHHPQPDPDRLRNQLAELLTGMGYTEIMNNSLTKAAYAAHFDAFEEKHSVLLENPLSQDLNAMRQSLLFGGLENIAFNQNRRITDIRFFEFGNIYSKDPGKTGDSPLAAYYEEQQLVIFLCGKKHSENWNSSDAASDFYQLKSVVGNILLKLGLRDENYEAATLEQGIFKAGMEYRYKNKHLASLGTIHPDYLGYFDIAQDVFYAELSWPMILKIVREASIVSSAVPKYPEVRRDLALLIDRKVTFDDIHTLAFKTEKKLLRSVGLFDVYEGNKIGKDKRSYAVSFVFRDDERTLTDKITDKMMKKLIAAFEKELNASIR